MWVTGFGSHYYCLFLLVLLLLQFSELGTTTLTKLRG